MSGACDLHLLGRLSRVAAYYRVRIETKSNLPELGATTKTMDKQLGFKAYYLAPESEGDGIVEAIVSVFNNVDSYKERVVKGAFKESLAQSMPKCIWGHDWHRPIAKVIEAKELAAGAAKLPDEVKANGGLYVKLQFSKEIDDSWQAYLKIKEGYVDEWSIGYRLKKYEVEEESGVWDLKEIDLFEVSPVLVGANRMTGTMSVKSFLSDGPVGMSLEQHSIATCEAVEGLVKRWNEAAADRDSEDAKNQPFFNRLKEAAEKLTAAIPIPSDARDAEEKAMTPSLDMERSRHEARLRAIRNGAS